MTNELVRAHAAFDEQRWRDAFDALSSIGADHLAADDLERLAVSAYLTGEDVVVEDAWARAHQAFVVQGDPARAARCAFWYACGLFFRGDMAPAMGWIARGKRVLEQSGADVVEAAWPLVLENLPAMFSGDAASVLPAFTQAVETASRFNDPTSLAMARLSLGQALVFTGRASEGVPLLDEAMVAVSAGEVVPIFTGIIYCAVISTCQRLFDLRRAREWTAALSRWCDAQQDLVPYRGNCLVHRCEIFQVQGDWPLAQVEAQRACDLLAGPPPWDTLGYAAYQLGELQRLRGELQAAEASYRRASVAGHEPEPGMSLLRLAQGRTDAAAASIRRIRDDRSDPAERSRVLPAVVEILLAAGDLDGAREAADELASIATMLDVPLLHASAGRSSGAVLLATGDARAGLRQLRDAAASWRALDAPYDLARTRELIAHAYRTLGDEASADLELASAGAAYETLGAANDMARLSPRTGKPGGLTERELEVLRLVASGKTNRQVAAELVLSEKTVARHVANIFTKLGLSSRSAATAYAYEHDLV